MEIVFALAAGLFVGFYVRAWIRRLIGLRWTRGVVSLVSSAPILPNASAIISVAGVRPFRLERLILASGGTPGGCADWLIDDVTVDGKTQFLHKGAVPGDMFSADILDSFLHFTAGKLIAMRATYVGPNEQGAAFVAAGIGQRRR